MLVKYEHNVYSVTLLPLNFHGMSCEYPSIIPNTGNMCL